MLEAVSLENKMGARLAEKHAKHFNTSLNYFLNTVNEYNLIGGWVGLLEWESAMEDIKSDALYFNY